MKNYIIVIFSLSAWLACTQAEEVDEVAGLSAARHLSCSYGISSSHCYGNPCKNAKCPYYPYASCIPNYCTCTADFYHNGKKLTKRQCTASGCPGGQVRHRCTPSPCDYTKCLRYPGAECRVNYCGGCHAEFWHNGKKLSKRDCDRKPCPYGQHYHHCIVSPCLKAKCPRYPAAICKDNFCGGCKAEFWHFGRKLSESECKKGSCPDGSRRHTCYHDPCETEKCPRYPYAICRTSYCGGCYAEFWHEGRKLRKSECKRGGYCPDGSDPVYCFTRPCSVTKCPAYPDAICHDDYCGGCNAIFKYHGKTLTKKQCNNLHCSVARHSTCKSPCAYKTCPKYPKATCKDDYCNCKAIFWYNGRKLSEHECKKDDLPLCRYIRESSLHLCPDKCNSHYGCAPDEECCSNTQCNECQKKYADDYRCPPADDFSICGAARPCNTNKDCEYNQICCSSGCGRICKKLTNLPTCKYRIAPQSLTPPYQCRDKCGEGWGCQYDEICCYNDYCHVCEKKPAPQLPKCKAYNPSYGSGYTCRDECYKDGDCGYLETCCHNGQCNKCELKKNAGEGLPKCEAHAGLSSIYDSKCDKCTLPHDCPAGEHCCFNGYCKKCEAKPVLPECKASASAGLRAYSSEPCRDDCLKDHDCGYNEHCCFNGFCMKCESKYDGGGGNGHVEDCPAIHQAFDIYCKDQCSSYNPCPKHQKCCHDGWCNVCINIYVIG